MFKFCLFKMTNEIVKFSVNTNNGFLVKSRMKESSTNTDKLGYIGTC